MIQAYDYSRPLDRSEVLVCLDDRRHLYHVLVHHISDFAGRYGFTFSDDVNSLHTNATTQFILKHIIIVDGVDSPTATVKAHRDSLSVATSATIALSYSTEDAFLRAGSDIDRLKVECGPSVNFLRPTYDGRCYTPPLQKLVDNSVCDSVRIKYNPCCVSRDLDVPDDVEAFFKQASQLFSDFGLTHRAPTDGFISARGSGASFYITCTKTDKITLDTTRIALVHSHDTSSGTLLYEGRYLPSSDSVETAVLYSRFPHCRAIVHTHASSRYTRNRKYHNRIAVPPMRYGEPQLGEMVARYVRSHSVNDFVIMEDHGELFFGFGETLDECYELIRSAIVSNP